MTDVQAKKCTLSTFLAKTVIGYYMVQAHTEMGWEIQSVEFAGEKLKVNLHLSMGSGSSTFVLIPFAYFYKLRNRHAYNFYD